MATVVNTSPSAEGNSMGMGLILGVLLVIAFVIGVIYFGGGYLRGSSAPAQAPAPAETGGSSNTTEIKVPEQIDVNVNEGQ